MIDRSKLTNLSKPQVATTIRRKEYQIELWSDGAVSKGKKGDPNAIPSVGYSCVGELKKDGKTVRRIVHYGNMTGVEETSQRGELYAFVIGIRDVLQSLLSDEVTLANSTISCFSDSAYCMNCFNGVNGGKAWFIKWIKNNWRTASMKPIENSDLWEELLPLVMNTSFICRQNNLFSSNHPVGKVILEGSLASKVEITQFKHVPGHAGIELNELADHYAVLAKSIEPWAYYAEDLI